MTATTPVLRRLSPRIATCVLFVHDLVQSIDFYREVLDLTVSLRTHSAALLVTDDGSQIVLREMGEHAQHALGSIGTQYVVWTAAHYEDLAQLGARLTSRDSKTTRQVIDRITIIEGRDPNDLPVIVTYPGPDCAPREHIFNRIYGW